MDSVIRRKTHVKAPQAVVISIAEIKARTDVLIEIDVGKNTGSIQCLLPSYSIDFGPVANAPYVTPDATLSVYFSMMPMPKVTDYEWTADVVVDGRVGTDQAANEDGTTAVAFKSHMPVSSNAAKDVFFAVSNVKNSFAIALFSVLPLKNFTMTCLVHHPVHPFDDIRQPWRICRLYSAGGNTTDAFIDWLAEFRTKLTLGLVVLIQPNTLQNPLHILCSHFGDPRLARMILKHCSKFINVEAKDHLGQTPLLVLLSKGFACDPLNKYYSRCIELIKVLVIEGGATVDAEDTAGNTALHYASASHRRGSQVLPLLLELGAPPDQKNEAGRTPMEELKLPENKLGIDDINEAELLLNKQKAINEQARFKELNRPTRSQSMIVLEEDRKSMFEALKNKNKSRLSGSTVSQASLNTESLANVPLLDEVGDSSPTPTSPTRRGADSLLQWEPASRVRIKTTDAAPPRIFSDFGVAPTRTKFAPKVIPTDGTGYPVNSKAAREPLETCVPPATLALLKHEFSLLDDGSEGFITVGKMRRAYCSLEGYGVSESSAEIDKMVTSMGMRRDGKVTFDEFCVLMLRIDSR